jgi:translation initiation factor 2 subunit 1
MAKSIASFRMYEHKYPKVDEIIIVKVKQIKEECVEVELIEFNNIVGNININEISKRRIRATRNISIDQKMAAIVLYSDEQKKCIDLSKKNVGDKESAQAFTSFELNRRIRTILASVSLNASVIANANECKYENTLEFLYEKFVWKLYKPPFSKHPFQIFEELSFGKDQDHQEKIFSHLAELSSQTKDIILKVIKHKMKLDSENIGALVQCTCFSPDGVDAIKQVLCQAKTVLLNKTTDATSGNQIISEIKFITIGNSQYRLSCKTSYIESGLSYIQEACDVAKQLAIEKHCEFKIIQGPCIFTTQDDKRLQSLMEKISTEQNHIVYEDDDETNGDH